MIFIDILFLSNDVKRLNPIFYLSIKTEIEVLEFPENRSIINSSPTPD